MTNQIPDGYVGNVFQQRYQIIRYLATGGFSYIFLAQDQKLLGRKVIIKTPLYGGDFCEMEIRRGKQPFQEKIKRLHAIFKEEAHWLIGLSEEGFDCFPELKDFFFEKSPQLEKSFTDAARQTFTLDSEFCRSPYLVMKYIEGERLDKYVQQNPLSVRQIQCLAKKILSVLCELHRDIHHKNVPYYYLFCDLKAENIIVVEPNNFYLLDLGSIIIYNKNINQVTGELQVTDGYSAPEIYSGHIDQKDNRDLDNRFDLFTVGALMFFCATGQHPIRYFQPNQLRHQFDYSFSTFQSNEKLQYIVKKATQHNKEERYKNVEEMLADVENL